jgi:hypothetical protein
VRLRLLIADRLILFAASLSADQSHEVSLCPRQSCFALLFGRCSSEADGVASEAGPVHSHGIDLSPANVDMGDKNEQNMDVVWDALNQIFPSTLGGLGQGGGRRLRGP